MNLVQRIKKISKLYEGADKGTKVLVGLILLGEVKSINKKD